LAHGAFFQHASPIVMLPPPIGLFPNLKPTATSAAGGQLFHTAPSSSTRQLGKVVAFAHEEATSNTLSATNKRQHPSSSCSETDSDDGKSQCSTASYDGSQRSQGKPNEVESAAKKRTWKVLLTSEQACEVLLFFFVQSNGFEADRDCFQIYESRPRSESEKCLTSAASRSQQTAEKYHVNAKTIRDIWNRITWIKATRSLWTDEASHLSPSDRAAGT
jgi:hypothetical protein